MSEFERVKPYLRLLDSGQSIELYPQPTGLPNTFSYMDLNGSHIKLKNSATLETVYIPFEMIEFVSPGHGAASVIRLRRHMEYKNGTLV